MRCRSCHSPIEFVSTVSGKKHPVEPDRVDAMDCEPGTKLITLQGEIVFISKKNLEDGSLVDVEGYESHFANCPDADEWRRK